MTDNAACESCTDCPSTEEDSEEEEEDFRTKLAEWAVDKRITHKAFSQLLKILAKDHPVIPNTTQYLVFISKVMTFSIVSYQVEVFSCTREEYFGEEQEAG
ncbi:hypothetical protein UPYG_G00260800 [Umbra pygmaea]|uniref:Uncharacterized protein n=1 Tax=Umbra pygmaea TaxID=75934 RepID=A0ABD0WDQ5_UMBPY